MSRQQITRRDVLRSLGALGISASVPLLCAAGAPVEMELTMTQTKSHPPKDLNQFLTGFSESSRRRLTELVSSRDFGARIPAADMKSLAENEKKTVPEIMLALLPLARSLSRPPISNFYVGAAARGVSGDVYLGANLEIPGQGLGNSVHGEQSAIANCYMHVEEGVTTIAVNAAPCGHCRQFMNEISPNYDIEVVVQGRTPAKLSSLLPESFGPKDLGGSGAFPIKRTNLTVPRDSDPAVSAALDAARISYAPYSKSPSGIGIVTNSGRAYKGSYFENAAFNPSLPPLQTALLALIASGEEFSAIEKVALVEAQSGMISQRDTTQVVLAAIAPRVKLHVAKAV